MSRNPMLRILIIILFTIAITQEVQSQALPGKLSGRAYYEYFLPGGSSDDFEEFRFNRYYFSYDQEISDDFAVRYRLDADRKADSKKLRPFIKHAYISWANLIPSAKIYFGMQATPSWSYSEAYWGYRSVQKTVQDLNGLGSSADVGIGLKGSMENGLRYHLLYANGSGYANPEDDGYKKVYTQIALTPDGKSIAGVNFDFERKTPSYTNYTLTLFAGIDFELVRAGFELVSRTEEGASDIARFGASVFGTIRIADDALFARMDVFDPDSEISDNRSDLLIVGYDRAAHKNFHIIPNLRREKTGPADAENALHINFEFKF